MNPTLAAVASIYFNFLQHLNMMLSACRTDAERSAIRHFFILIRHNYFACINKPVDEKEPRLAGLVDKANQVAGELRTIEKSLGDFSCVLALSQRGAEIGTEIANCITGRAPTALQAIAARLNAREHVEEITVREFLSFFGVERRGALKVEAIRGILDSLGLVTEPDFDDVWIDAPIEIKLKRLDAPHGQGGSQLREAPSNGLAAPQPVSHNISPSVEVAQSDPASAQVQNENASIVSNAVTVKGGFEDPTYRIGSLPAANKRLVFVRQGEALNRAVTLMLQYDFSQVPIMQGEREIKGIVTWKSIAIRKALGYPCELVEHCKEEARVVDSNSTLFSAIPEIVQYGYVLVRDHRDKRITGIVAASDLSLQFQALAEPFLLIREVELHVRQLLGEKITTADLASVSDVNTGTEPVQNILDLSFGQYVRLLQSPNVWTKLDLNVDRAVFCELLESVRVIRNDVMHFDPDPMTSDDLAMLKRASAFMQSLYELMPNAI